ncbi:MAG: hypothetical protein DMF88_14205 [Acidobacteria bacterium]|nr:MAG: hypothetical protein DMF88_14205 [Acidobacteriota bacterium]
MGDGGEVGADLRVPERATGLVIVAHGSGSSRFSSRNRAVAGFLEANRFGTLLLDLLTREEESVDVYTGRKAARIFGPPTPASDSARSHSWTCWMVWHPANSEA